MKKDYFDQLELIDQSISDTRAITAVKNSVREKINCSDESEDKSMIKSKKSRKLRPLILVAAILAISAVSVFSVNAATDGEVFEKVKLFINGEEVSTDTIKSGVDENGNPTYTIEVDEETTEEVKIEIVDEIDGIDESGEVVDDMEISFSYDDNVTDGEVTIPKMATHDYEG